MRRVTAGGVVFEPGTLSVYLAKPANGFGPYEWEFPKGGVEPGETLQDAAEREVEEETGIPAGVVPGSYLGCVQDHQDNHYFVLVRVGAIGPRDGEMEEVRCVSLAKALKMLEKAGNNRDIEVLSRAFEFMKRRLS